MVSALTVIRFDQPYSNSGAWPALTAIGIDIQFERRL